jgi:hypothetical protein
MYKSSDSGKGGPEAPVPPRPPVKMGPERSLKGFTRIEVNLSVKETVKHVAETGSEDH